MRWLALLLAAGCGRYGFQADAAASVDVATDADTSGLVAWYAMDALTVTGAMADASGHGHVATCSTIGSGCPTIVAGRIGSAMRFDGANNLLTIANAADFDSTAGFTVASWVWIDAQPSSYSCYVNKVIGTGGNDSWQVCITPNQEVFFGTNVTGIDAGDPLFTGLNTMPLTSWHHIAITWDGSFKGVWFDGAEKAGDQAADGFDSGSILVGYDTDSGTPVASFAGILDELRIYNRALSAAEITALAQ